MTRSRVLWILAVWIVLFAAALLLDRHVAYWVQKTHPIARGSRLAWSLKLPGYFPVTLGIAAILLLWRREFWRIALSLVLSGPLVGLGYMLLKWIIGRRRPVIVIAPFDFHPLAHGFTGLIHAESGLSFPSGHTALAFATAACLAAVLPRWAAWFVLVAGAVAAERVLENAHYLSDVIAGAGVGILCAWAALRLSGLVGPPTAARRPAA